MRVISGKFKGHHLVPFHDSKMKPTIRPTTDRVKETMFNIIQFSVPQSSVLDLFSGTGSLGIEALSRGSDRVVFVDQNRKSIEVLQKNLEKLKISQEMPEFFNIIHSSVEKFLKRYEGPPFDLIFIDPPFTEKMAHDVMIFLSKSAVCGEDTWISIESGRKEKLLDEYENLFRCDIRYFGDKVLSFFRNKKHNQIATNDEAEE